MFTNNTSGISRPNFLRWAGLIIGLGGGLYWLYLGIAEVWYLYGFDWLNLLLGCIPGLLIVIGTLVAWKWERLGGSLLAILPTGYILLGTILIGEELGSWVVTVWLILALPPLLVGLLFFFSARRAKGSRAGRETDGAGQRRD